MIMDPIAIDDLLNFNFEEENNLKNNTQNALVLFNEDPSFHNGLPFPDLAEEELEWLSNEEAFPSLESCLNIFPEGPSVVLNHHSPVSVLDNNTKTVKKRSQSTKNREKKNLPTFPVTYPKQPRSNIPQKRRLSGFVTPPLVQKQQKHQQSSLVVSGRKCAHCQVDNTPQWRAGPTGPKTLCNACGVRYKSGRLVPEYRPANSPTFSSVLHSNSHRKVVEMRKQKQMVGIPVNEPCEYSRVVDVLYIKELSPLLA